MSAVFEVFTAIILGTVIGLAFGGGENILLGCILAMMIISHIKKAPKGK